MDILRIAALGTAGVLLGITVKGAKPEFAASCDGRCRPLHSCRDRRKNAVSARHARTNEIVSPGGLIVSEYAAENAWDHVCGTVFRRDL